MVKQKCPVCGRQMHKYNERPWGKNQDHLRYICPYGHTKYVKIDSPYPETREKIFKLSSEADFIKAEKFKAKLENEGYHVTTQPCGLNDVKIKGEK